LLETNEILGLTLKDKSIMCNFVSQSDPKYPQWCCLRKRSSSDDRNADVRDVSDEGGIDMKSKATQMLPGGLLKTLQCYLENNKVIQLYILLPQNVQSSDHWLTAGLQNDGHVLIAQGWQQKSSACPPGSHLNLQTMEMSAFIDTMRTLTDEKIEHSERVKSYKSLVNIPDVTLTAGYKAPSINQVVVGTPAKYLASSHFAVTVLSKPHNNAYLKLLYSILNRTESGAPLAVETGSGDGPPATGSGDGCPTTGDGPPTTGDGPPATCEDPQ